MNQMSREIAFNFRRQDDKDIPESHMSILEDKALNHIRKLMSEGYVEGQLIDNIGDVEYIGYWMRTKT